ncbi:MAG TPA: DUF455 family protein [Thermoanaerobaculia bacterium]|jgi:uncharacterized ferritin-like protein (DUF455 family)|nr:DUF455 family protein [Thermoanaerobaculia bacterium]
MTPEFFAENPARDSRFDVKERWIECPNLPADHPQHQLEFFQRQMNEEVNSIEASARCITDFPNVDWDLRMQLARQCADESRHAVMYRRILESRGGFVGQFPVLNFQYRIIVKRPTIIERLAIQNRSFEAGGIDAITFGIAAARNAGDHEIADMYEAQLADEVNHVRFANDYIHKCIQRDRRTLLEIGNALTAASVAFAEVMGTEGTDGVAYPIDEAGRLDAGFTPDEVRAALEIHAKMAEAHA